MVGQTVTGGIVRKIPENKQDIDSFMFVLIRTWYIFVPCSLAQVLVHIWMRWRNMRYFVIFMIPSQALIHNHRLVDKYSEESDIVFLFMYNRHVHACLSVTVPANPVLRFK